MRDPELFQGKWGDLDTQVAHQLRDCLQSIVDHLPSDGEIHLRVITTVLVTAVEDGGPFKASRLSTTLTREELREAIDACLDGAEAQGTVGEIWGRRLFLDFAQRAVEELESLSKTIVKPIEQIDYSTMPAPLLESLARKRRDEVTADDIEGGYSMIVSIFGPVVEEIITQLRDTRERIERSLSEHPQMGFHADL